MWGNGARALAERALDEAEGAKRDTAVVLERLTSHVDSCGRNWASLERRLDEGAAWRASMDRKLWSVILMVIATLLSAVGFFASHLPIFTLK